MRTINLHRNKLSKKRLFKYLNTWTLRTGISQPHMTRLTRTQVTQSPFTRNIIFQQFPYLIEERTSRDLIWKHYSLPSITNKEQCSNTLQPQNLRSRIGGLTKSSTRGSRRLKKKEGLSICTLTMKLDGLRRLKKDQRLKSPNLRMN